MSTIILSMASLLVTGCTNNDFEGSWKCKEPTLGINYILDVDDTTVSIKMDSLRLAPVSYKEIKEKEHGKDIHAIIWDMDGKKDWYLFEKESNKYVFGRKGDDYPCTKQLTFKTVKDIVINGSEGGIGMPDRTGLLNMNTNNFITDKEIDLVSKFVANGMTGPGNDVFQGSCAACHGEDGKGFDGLTSSLIK